MDTYLRYSGARIAGLGDILRAAALSCALVATGSVAQSVRMPTIDSPEVERWRVEWPHTDFGRTTVKYEEIMDSGVPKDGISALTNPAFLHAKDVVTFSPNEAVVSVEIDGEARAYPLRYLIWHEIVNDAIKTTPIVITFCPLCNSAIVFDARPDGKPLLFGVTGKLRNSDLIMYDQQSRSWWQQFTGEGIVGTLAGETLKPIPSALVSWDAFRRDHPEGLVMAQPEAGGRTYGANPYVGYDSADWPMLYQGARPPHGVAALARVVVVGDRAWPLERLSAAGEITEDGVRLTWVAGQASAVDQERVAQGREVGDVRVYDAQTGAPLVYMVAFAFAFDAFHPKGRWMMGG